MAELGKAEVKASDAAKHLTLKVVVTGQQLFRFRCWLGVLVLKLAARIIGCQVDVSLLGGHRDPAPSPSLAIPPIHLSVDELAKGIAGITWEEARRIRVWLDGMEVKQVMAYDCEAGWVERLELDCCGRMIVRDDRVAIERVRGTVAAEYREAA